MGRGAGGGGRRTETIKGDTYKQNTACTRRKTSKTPLLCTANRQKHSNTERTAILYLEVWGQPEDMAGKFRSADAKSKTQSQKKKKNLSTLTDFLSYLLVFGTSQLWEFWVTIKPIFSFVNLPTVTERLSQSKCYAYSPIHSWLISIFYTLAISFRMHLYVQRE